MNSLTALHVVPIRTGGWRVQREGEAQPLSEHPSATSAERAAVRFARDLRTAEVVVHDRRGHIRRAQR